MCSLLHVFAFRCRNGKLRKVTVSSEDALARHRKEYPKLHDKLGRIEVMLKREMDAPEFDREKVK